MMRFFLLFRLCFGFGFLCVYFQWRIKGERYVYKFVCDPEALFNMAYGNNCGDAVNSIPTSCRSSSISNFTSPAVLNDANITQNFYN